MYWIKLRGCTPTIWPLTLESHISRIQSSSYDMENSFYVETQSFFIRSLQIIATHTHTHAHTHTRTHAHMHTRTHTHTHTHTQSHVHTHTTPPPPHAHAHYTHTHMSTHTQHTHTCTHTCTHKHKHKHNTYLNFSQIFHLLAQRVYINVDTQ